MADFNFGAASISFHLPTQSLFRITRFSALGLEILTGNLFNLTIFGILLAKFQSGTEKGLETPRNSLPFYDALVLLSAQVNPKILEQRSGI